MQCLFVLARTRSDSRRLIERSGFGVRCLRQRSSSPSSSGLRQGTSALGFCQSTSGLDVVSPHCIREPTDRDRPAARQLNDKPFAERNTVELVQHGLVEAFADTIGLRALGFGARVIDVLDREIELVLMPLRIATVLAAAVGQYP